MVASYKEKTPNNIHFWYISSISCDILLQINSASLFGLLFWAKFSKYTQVKNYLVNITKVTLPPSALSSNKQSDQDEPASDHRTDKIQLQKLDHVNSIQSHCYQCLTATVDEVGCLIPECSGKSIKIRTYQHHPAGGWSES